MRKATPSSRTERLIGSGVRIAVSIAAAIAFTGGLFYLHRHGLVVSDFHRFQGAPHSLRDPAAITRCAATLDAEGMIQFGVLVLIVIPVLRVVAYGIAFLLHGDRLHSIVTLIVLSILFFSLLGDV